NTFYPLIDLNLKTEPDPRIAKLALDAARRANELTHGKAYYILDTLAVALYRTGDSAGAAAAEEKAIKELEAMVPEKDRSSPGYKNFVKNLESRLEQFRKAPAAKDAKSEKP